MTQDRVHCGKTRGLQRIGCNEISCFVMLYATLSFSCITRVPVSDISCIFVGRNTELVIVETPEEAESLEEPLPSGEHKPVTTAVPTAVPQDITVPLRCWGFRRILAHRVARWTTRVPGTG